MSVNPNTNQNNFLTTGTTSEQTTYTILAPTNNGANTGSTAFGTTNGLLNQSPGSAYRYDATTNKWYKYPGGSGAPVFPSLQPVIDIIATPPTTPNDQDSYIVKATATGAWAGQENKIATWSSFSSSWVFYTPSTSDRTTVTSSGATVATGTYEFDGTSWNLIQAGVPVEPPADRASYGNYALCSQQIGNFNKAPYFIVGSDLIHFGAFNPGNVVASGTSDNSTVYGLVHRMTYSWCNLINGTYTPVSQYEPKFVDAATAGNYTVAIDHLGKLWANGNIVAGTGITTTTNGTTAVTTTPNFAFYPVPYFHGNNITLCKVGVHWFHNQTTIACNTWVVSNTGDLYITGFNNTGQIGDGTTTQRTGWFKWTGLDPIKKVQMAANFIVALTTTGKLYYSGQDSHGGASCFGAGNKTTPFLTQSNVSDFEIGSNLVMIVKNDGTLFTGGLGTRGELGKGTNTSSAMSAVPGIINAKIPVPSNARALSAYIGTDNKIYFTGNNYSGSMGLSTTGLGANRNTYAAANVNAVFQGSVVKAAMPNSTAIVMDSSGNIYTAGWNNMRGYGSNDTTTVTGDANRWIRAALPEAATNFTWSDINGDMVYALCGSHGMYMWGYNTNNWSGWTTNQGAFYSPTYVPLNVVDDGTPVSALPEFLANKTGNLGTLTAITAVTDILDGGSNQTVTFTVSYTGATTGLIPLTNTATGTDITTSTSQTSAIVLTSTSGTLQVSFLVTAANISALTSPASQAQIWNLTINGTTLTSPSTASGNGWRVTVPDMTACLSTSLANYNAAGSGDLVPVTTAEYNCLLAYATSTAGLTNSAIGATPQAGYSAANWVIGINNYDSAVRGNDFLVGVPYLARIRYNTASAGTTIGSGVQLGYATTNTGAAVAISNKTTVSASTDVNAYCYFVVKNPTVVTPAGSNVRMFTGSSSIGVRYGNIAAPNDIAAYKTGSTDVTSSPVGTQANIQLAIQIHSI